MNRGPLFLATYIKVAVSLLFINTLIYIAYNKNKTNLLLLLLGLVSFALMFLYFYFGYYQSLQTENLKMPLEDFFALTFYLLLASNIQHKASNICFISQCTITNMQIRLGADPYAADLMIKKQNLIHTITSAFKNGVTFTMWINNLGTRVK